MRILVTEEFVLLNPSSDRNVAPQTGICTLPCAGVLVPKVMVERTKSLG